MSMRAGVVILLASASITAHGVATQPAAGGFTAEQVFSYPFPNQLAAASTTDRIAWAFNEQARRNIWVAEAPAFAARKRPASDHDDGQELTPGRCLSPPSAPFDPCIRIDIRLR